MKRVLLTAAIALSTLSAAEAQKCFTYNPDAFSLKQYIYANNKKITHPAKLEKFNIYYFYKKGKPTNATIEYKVNGHTFYTPDLYCDKFEGEKFIQCAIECDGGSFALDNNHNIKTSRLDLYRDDPDAIDSGVKILLQKDPNKFTKAKAIACPKKIPHYDALDDSYYKDHPNGLYVCYDFKFKGKYDGCIRSVKPCRFIHRQHFGKYLNKNESKKALKRCKSSHPNKQFIDNKEGLFVCYDYKNKFGEYSGCFRSKNSCKSIHKEHFGKYPSSYQSFRALLRCNSSAPRK